jgi:uncharacterized membrane protein
MTLDDSTTIGSTVRKPIMKKLGVALLVLGLVVTVYGGVRLAKFRAISRDATMSADGMAFVYAERSRAWANELRAKQRAAAVPFVAVGIAVVIAGAILLKLASANPNSSPPSIFK